MSDEVEPIVESGVVEVDPVAGVATSAVEPEVEADPVRRAYNEVMARPRDEQGRFVPAAATEAAPKTTVEKAQTEVAPPAVAAEPVVAEEAPATAVSRYGDLDPIEANVRPRLAAAGIDFPTYTQRLIAADEFLMKEPQKAIAWLAQQYGIDLRTLAGNQPAAQQQTGQAQQQPPQDVYQTALQQLDQRQRALENNILSQHIDGQIKAFAAQTDKYPHYEAARQKMAELFNQGFGGSLEEAYNVAVYTDTGLRTKIDADREKQRIDEAAKRAVVARRAAAVNVEPSVAAKPARQKTMDETIAEVTRAAFGAH